jgi:tight adherence protein C
MPIVIVLLIVLAVGGFATAAAATLVDLRRRQALSHAAGTGGGSDDDSQSVLIDGNRADTDTRIDRVINVLGGKWKTNEATASLLVQAGYDGTRAAVTYGAIRVVCLIAPPLLVLLFSPARAPMMLLAATAAAAVAGYILPSLGLTHMASKRRQRMVRSLPDVMDLLVLCVEAGLGFDAAVLRVAKEMQIAHPDMAYELLLVNRKVNAGVSREEALRAAYARTGLDELRVLVQHLVQSERLGTSIGKVLRVYGHTLRVRRKQTAEKKAALAPLKMVFPMAGFIMPALFIMILGPAMLQVVNLFGGPRLGSGVAGATPIINP